MTAAILTWQRRKSAGVTNNNNDGSVLFKCPREPWQCDSKQHASITNHWFYYLHLWLTFCDMSECLWWQRPAVIRYLVTFWYFRLFDNFLLIINSLSCIPYSLYCLLLTRSVTIVSHMFFIFNLPSIRLHFKI